MIAKLIRKKTLAKITTQFYIKVRTKLLYSIIEKL